MVAVTGKAKIMPGMPQSIAKTTNAKIQTKAFILIFEPVIFGVIKLPFNQLNKGKNANHTNGIPRRIFGNQGNESRNQRADDDTYIRNQQ